MKYVLVYHERNNGYNWSVRNQDGLYAAWRDDRTDKVQIRGWTTAKQASDYIYYMQADCVWAPWPEDRQAKIKPVTTAASYKPAHGGYPNPPRHGQALVLGREIDRMAASCASIGAAAGCISSNHPAVNEISRNQPLAWPTIPQVNDGSNEEASTIPATLIEDFARPTLVSSS